MRKFYRDEENPYDSVDTSTASEIYDQQKPPAPELASDVSGDYIRNFDEAGRRLDTGNTGTVKLGVGVTTAGINRAAQGTDIVFWAGATQDNRATAPFRVTAAGDVIANSLSLPINFPAGATVSATNALHFSKFVQTDGGITSNNTLATRIAGVLSPSQAFTVNSGTNIGLLVSVGAIGAAPTSVKYNNVTMTLVTSQVLTGTGETFYVYKLSNPSTGANNIDVTSGAGGNVFSIAAIALNGVDQATFVEASAKALANTVSITTLSKCAVIVAFEEQNHSGGTASLNQSTYTTKYVSSTNLPVITSTGGAAGDAIAVGMTAVLNEVFTSTPVISWTGGTGTVVDAIIAVSIIPFTAPTGAIVKTSAVAVISNEPLINFVGFASLDTSVGGTVPVSASGIATGFSSLTQGETYYLSDTAGVIQPSPGTYRKIIGYALSTTTLLIAPTKSMGEKIAKTANYTYTAESDGFLISNAPAGTTVTLTVNGIATSATAPAATSIPFSVPVVKGNTYIANASATNIYFIPLT